MEEPLFVYGTLRPTHAPHEIADLVHRFVQLGEGTVHGHFYDLGDFPAVVLDHAAGTVKGLIFMVPNNAWTRLDAYEEYHPADPTGSLFIRQKTLVSLGDGTDLQCWIYVYNKSVHGHRPQTEFASIA